MLSNYRASLEPGSGNVDDLASLSTLDEASLLRELQARYSRDIIYTYIGDILVAVNPYKPVKLYGQQHRQQYRGVKLRSSLPPHLYALSDKAYHTMLNTGESQCCVVSGESGAGKTESTKLLVEHLIDLCRHPGNDIQEKIIQVNPLLEAFGNARTVINDNSSRFGKYIEIMFSIDGAVLGAQISEYLLEKSRVINQAMHEQNYHIFYYMFAGLTEDQLRINLLNQPETHRIMRPQDGSRVFKTEEHFMFCRDMWNNLRHVMTIIGLTPEEVDMILALLAAILHISDIQFERDQDTDGVFIQREDLMEIAAELLAVSPDELAAALISNVTYLQGERIRSLKNPQVAGDGRDALAKALYGRLFGWIVRQINLILQPDREQCQYGSSIGILDIAGFENFPRNSFEQLCINVANEQLQFYFNQHIFQWELDEYQKEGIKAKQVKYADNKQMIEMFMENHGFFALLDEESHFPQGTDATLLDKLSKNLNKRSQFTRAKGRDLAFTINHYAGPVVYRVEEFLEKNRDTLSINLSECMRNSESQIVCDLFTANLSDIGSLMVNPNAPKRSRKSVLLCKDKDFTYTKGRSLSKRASMQVAKDRSRVTDKQLSRVNSSDMGLKFKTIGAHFRNSLTHLMRKLLDSEPCFIRCIKPNSEKRPSCFVPDLIQKQLKYTGILETVRIRRMGFPTRILHHIFIQRYKILVFPFTTVVEATQKNALKILKTLKLEDYAMGNTKVFLRYWHLEQLNLKMDELGRRIIYCQKYVRRFLARKRYKRNLELSRQDIAAVRGFCVYIDKESQDKLYYLQTQKELDKERNLKETEKRDAVNENIYQMTPLHIALQKGPGGSKGEKVPPPTASKPHIPTEMRPGLRRQSSSSISNRTSRDAVYLTDTMITPTKRSPIDVDIPPAFARPTAIERKKSVDLPGSPQPMPATNQVFYVSVLGESIPKMKSLDSDVWAKLYYMEMDTNCAKLYIRHAELLIDGASDSYDGERIGINAFDNSARTAASTECRSKIGKGLHLWRDFHGSIYACRMPGSCEVIVKGHQNATSYCIPESIAQASGRIGMEPSMIYDINLYKRHLTRAIKTSKFDELSLQRLSLISISFARNKFEDHVTPCWLSLINFCALDMLGNKNVLEEIMRDYKISLSTAEYHAMTCNWYKLKLRDENKNSLSADNYYSMGKPSRSSVISNGRSDSPTYASSIPYDTETIDGRTMMPARH